MKRIRLNDGSEYAVEFCGQADRVVGSRLQEAITAAGAARVVSDGGNTRKITCLLDGPESPIVTAVYEGYTDLIGILIDRWDRKALIQLQKEV